VDSCGRLAGPNHLVKGCCHGPLGGSSVGAIVWVGWVARTRYANSSVGVAREGSETAGLAGVLAAVSLHLRGWLSCGNGSMS
jgi:hypothetical protein